MSNKADELRDMEKKIDQMVTEYREYIEKFMENDSDDFTGMHTTRGIPEDGFYGESYKLIRELTGLFKAHQDQLLRDEAADIRALRNSVKVTQQDMAVFLDVSRLTYLNWEKDIDKMPLGKYFACIKELERLATIKSKLGDSDE